MAKNPTEIAEHTIKLYKIKKSFYTGKNIQLEIILGECETYP